MAEQNLTRKRTLMHKRKISVFAEEIDVVDLLATSADTYKLANLPERSLIVRSLVKPVEAVNGIATVDLGTSASGSNLLNDADVAVSTATESTTNPFDTGTGLPLYITPTWGSPVTQGRLVVVVEYIEYDLKYDEYTETDNV